MSRPALQFEGVSKKFSRSLSSAVLYGLQDLARKLLRIQPPAKLRGDEFWALHEISFTAHPGECLGIIGPNGAGKSTLLKLASRDFPPSLGRVRTAGRVTSLIRLGSGLQPMLTGRENILAECSRLGLDRRATEAKMDEIAAFAELEQALDRPVKQYSDGMYARLEFSLATSTRPDLLLIDEVLAVGDMAFQMRCLERLEQLKQAGCTILFVSHSEMNVRQIADRCLLLFDGQAVACGETDALFHRYYESVGYRNRQLKSLGAAPEMPEDFAGTACIRRLRMAGAEQEPCPGLRCGDELELLLEYAMQRPVAGTVLVLQFWNAAGLLMATLAEPWPEVPDAAGRLRVVLPALGLAAGVYRLAGGFRAEGRWLGYAGELLRLAVYDAAVEVATGPYRIRGKVQPAG